MKKDTQKKLIIGAGAVLLARAVLAKSRPPLVRGTDPGFNWQGQQIQGGQGSAITNVGAPASVKTDYVLVATAMKNYALNTVGVFPGTQTPRLPRSYSWKCLDYWYNEAGRLLGAGGTTKSLGTALTIVTLGTAEQRASKIDPFNNTRGFWRGSSPLGQIAFGEVFDAWKAFHDRLPASIEGQWGIHRVMGLPATYSPTEPHFSLAEASAFWDALLRVGVGFDVSKSVPSESVLWAATIAALKTTGSAAATVLKTGANVAGKGLAAAGKGIFAGLMSSPTGMLVLGGAAYLVYNRFARRTA